MLAFSWRTLRVRLAKVCVLGLVCFADPQTLNAADLGWQTRTFPGVVAVQAIAQSEDRYLWFAGTDGVQRFDGLAWTPITSLPAGPARRLLATKEGLWVATGGGFLQQQPRAALPIDVAFRTERGDVYLLSDGQAVHVDFGDVPSSWVWAFARRMNTPQTPATVLAGTESGVVEIPVGPSGKPGKAKMLVGPDRLPSPLVTALLLQAPEVLWVGTSTGLVEVRLRGSQITSVVPRLQGESILNLARAPNGGIVATTSTGVWDVSQPNPRKLLPPGDAAGLLWSGPGVGLLAVQSARIKDVAPESGDTHSGDKIDISVSDPLSILRDHEGSIWVGQLTGPLTQAFKPQVGNVGSPEGLLGSMAFSLHRAHDEAIWLTTTEGVVQMKGTTFSSFKYGRDIPIWSARSIGETSAGTLLFAAEKAVLQYKDSRFGLLTSRDGLQDDFVRSVHVDARDTVWIGWENAGISTYGNGVISAAGRRDVGTKGAVCSGAQAFAGEPAPGTVWWASPMGLTRVVVDADGTTRAQCFDKNHGLANEAIAVARSPRGEVWAATLGRAAMARLQGERFVPLPEPCGVAAGGFFSLTTTGNDFWATSNHGAFRASWDQVQSCMEGRRKTVDWLRVDEHSGMRSAICTATFAPTTMLDKDGDLWLATTAGVSIIKINQPLQPPHAAIEGLTVNGGLLEGSSEIPPRPQSLQWAWTAPTFVLPQSVRFRYQLSGVDTNWVDAGATRAAHYGLLSPGRYTFAVQAYHAGSPASQAGPIASRRVHVQPAVTQTLWFRLAMLATLGAFAFVLYKLRVRQLTARHKAVHAERARLAREMHDGLGQAFLGVRFHLDALDHLLSKRETNVTATQLLDESRKILTRAEGDLRETIWNLRATQVDRPTLKAMLEQQCERMGRELSREVRLRWQGPVPPASGLRENELPRILEEAVTNAIVHGHASRVDVFVVCNAEGLLMTVANEGVQVASPTGASGRFGLLGMQERAVRLGGALTAQARKGGGFEVALHIPAPEMKPDV